MCCRIIKEKTDAQITQYDNGFIDNLDNINDEELNRIPLCFFVEFIFKYYSVYINRYLEDSNLTPRQIYILLILGIKECIPQEEIATRLHINETAVTRDVKLMEEKELLKRISDNNDKRRKLVSLTDNGRKIIEYFKQVNDESEEKLLNYFNENELHILRIMLKKMILTLSDILEKQ